GAGGTGDAPAAPAGHCRAVHGGRRRRGAGEVPHAGAAQPGLARGLPLGADGVPRRGRLIRLWFTIPFVTGVGRCGTVSGPCHNGATGGPPVATKDDQGRCAPPWAAVAGACFSWRIDSNIGKNAPTHIAPSSTSSSGQRPSPQSTSPM